MRGVFDDKEFEEHKTRPDTELTLGTGALYTGLSFVITTGPAITTTQLSFIGTGSFLGGTASSAKSPDRESVTSSSCPYWSG